MTAREQFTIGQRVRATTILIESHPKQKRSGVVVGFGREDWIVAVRIDGQKSRQVFHQKFWEPAQ